MRNGTQRVALAFVVAIAFFVGIGTVSFVPNADPVGVATADNHTENGNVSVSVERVSDRTVLIAVSQFAFDDDIDNATIDVSMKDKKTTIDGAEREASGNYEFETSIETLVGGAEITDARPTITIESQNSSASVDLRRIQFGNTDGLSVDDGTYRFPVERVIGLNDQTTVPMAVNGARFNATFECGSDCRSGNLTFDPGDFQADVSPLVEQNYEAYPDTSYLSASQQFDLSSVGTAKLISTDDGLAISHPLLFGGSEYVVNISTDDPNAQYIVKRTATEPDGVGQVEVPSRIAWSGSIEATVKDTRRSETVISLESPGLSPEVHDVTYDRENKSLNFSKTDGALPDSVDTVWLNESGQIQRFDEPEVNGPRLDVSSLNATPPFQLLVVSDETTVRVSVDTPGESAESTQTPEDDGGGPQERGLVSTIIILVGSFVVMGLLGILAIPGFGLVGRWLQSALGGAALIFSVAILPIGVVAFQQFGTEWYGIHIYILAALIMIGLTTGALRTFNRTERQSGLVNFGLAICVVPLATLILQFFLTELSLTGVAGAGGATIGSFAGFLAAVKYIDPKHPVTIRLVDEQTGDLVTKTDQITAQKVHENNEKEPEVTGGTATIMLPEGEWRFISGSDERNRPREGDFQVRHKISDKSVVNLPVERAGASIRITNMANNEPIREATATIEPESNSNDSVELIHIREGLYRGDLPADVSTATVQVGCDGYQNETETYENIDDRLNDTIKLARKQGTLEVNVTLEGVRVGNIDVVITPQSDVVTPENQYDRTTNERGRVVESGIAIGEWDVKVELPTAAEEFEIRPIDNPVTISENETTTVQSEIQFTYELPPDVNRQLSELRDRLDSITSHPRSDVAIPSFYASVIHELLETIEELPQSAETFLRTEESPDATAEALLTAAEMGIDSIDEAMSSKQNVDLFAACGDLAAVEADWRGRFDLEELFQVAAKESGRRRSDIAERLDEVNETISQELRELSEVRPARDMWEETRDLARDTNRNNLEMAAITLLTLGLLDAIESLFEREPLRKRMTRTVF